jgi:hypothetical protein
MLYGWDISTSIVGLASFHDDGKFDGVSFLDLRKAEGQLAKADAFEEWLRALSVGLYSDAHHFIEERLGGFAGGRTSAQVLMKLAQFNAMCSYILWRHARDHSDRKITYLHPSTWKSIMKREGLIIPKGADKKELTLAFVRRKQPEFPIALNRNEKPQPWCYDTADAWCIGRAGWLKLQETSGQSITRSTP